MEYNRILKALAVLLMLLLTQLPSSRSAKSKVLNEQIINHNYFHTLAFRIPNAPFDLGVYICGNKAEK
jgi:hypothetical protein